MKPIPIYDDTAPIACTASSDELPVRIDQVERIRAHLLRHERTDHGLLLHFTDEPEIAAEVRGFTVDEKACCAFWGFDVTAANGVLTLRWDGPPEVNDFFDELVVFFDGYEPLTAIDGLL